MLRLAYVGGLGMMAGPASLHLTPADVAQVVRVHDRGSQGGERDRFREAWREHGAELVADFDQLVGSGDIDGLVVCAGKNGDDLPIIARLTALLAERCERRPFILHLSTLSPNFSEVASGFCADKGVDYANYPLTGGPLGASLGGADPKGMLILASGERSLYDRVLPLLKKLGHPRYFGEQPGAGAITKLIGHHLVYNGLAGISAATALHAACFNQGQLGGEVQGNYLGYLNGGAGHTRQWDVAMSKGVLQGVWDQGFLIPHAVVDAVYAGQLALDQELARYVLQPMLNTALSFAFIQHKYPQQVHATHAVVRELLQPHARELDEFMLANGALEADPAVALKRAEQALPESVARTVLASPTREQFEDAFASE